MLLDYNGFDLEQLDVKLPRKEEQLGLFLPTSTPINVYLIKSSKPVKDLFEP